MLAMALGLGRFRPSECWRACDCESWLTALMIFLFGCFLLTVFVMILAVRSLFWGLMIIVVTAGLLILGGFLLLRKAEASIREVTAKPHFGSELRFTWASCRFDRVGSWPRPAFRHWVAVKEFKLSYYNGYI